ncbi:MAG: DUF3570 domain-containing protein [Fibrobacteria bacterium]
MLTPSSALRGASTRVRAALAFRFLPFLKAVVALGAIGIAVAPPSAVASAAESDQGVDLKYMYYWDRNGVWNHTPALAYFRKFASVWKFQWDQEVDAVSGASRRLGLRNIGRLADNDLKVDAITGASQQEFRHSEQATASYSNAGRNASASLYFSDENDYRSYSPSVSGSWDFNERNTTLGGSLALFLDDMHPTGRFSGEGGSREIVSLTASLAQVLSPLTLGSLTANVIRSTGFLGHPYNPAVTADGRMFTENLPNHKTSVAISGLIIQGFHLGERLGSLRLEARHYRDDWKMISNTADLQWYQYLMDGTYVRLRARGYQQGTAAFANEYYRGDEVYRTPDIRFYGFSSLTLGMKIGSGFPESWGESALLPDRWDLSYDHGMRNTKGELGGPGPMKHYQLFSKDESYIQGTFMVGLAFDL